MINVMFCQSSHLKRVNREQPSKSTTSIKSKSIDFYVWCIFWGKGFDISRKCFEPSEMKEWAIDDLNKTIQWLESQEEKPDPSEVTKIAAEGILTCLQDVIRSLEEKREDFGNLNKIFIFSDMYPT
ncbi:DNA-repair protein XRCC1 [Vigna unguiculata]|uniref:DNA-repair protein XRCC1 n=1 Tax=Vigna unguiculata TaxID=3917 RepID=A0A4D6MRY9_VIGUN|nr:DNA-repair protein XRCC1 [Vigna unguiculata]